MQRDKSKSCGVFKLKVDYNKVLDEIRDYNLFSINVSSANYVDNQLLVGEIEFLSNNEVYAILSINPNASVRDAISNPTFNIKTNIFDDVLINKIPHFNIIYNYIIEHIIKRSEKSMNEFFDVLNENGEYTNKIASRDECHKNGLWHKAVVVFIISNDNKKVLLQQRSATKRLWPNL